MHSRVPCFVVGMLSLVFSNLSGAQGYQWTEIVVEGATVIQVFGLNDKGQTATSTSIGSGIYGNGTFTPLPPPPEGYQVTALGINNGGVITGVATTAGIQQGFILRGSTYTFFSRKGWYNTAPRAIADTELITGYTTNDLVNLAGFIYDPATDTFTDATPPESNNTIVQGINNFGRITGHGEDTVNGRYGFVWQQRTITNGKSELLPFLSRLKIDTSLSARARGINDSGVVTGFATTHAGTYDGFVGNDALGYQRLVAPGGEIAGNSTFCSGINNSNQVACYVWDSASQPQGAFIGSPP